MEDPGLYRAGVRTIHLRDEVGDLSSAPGPTCSRVDGHVVAAESSGERGVLMGRERGLFDTVQIARNYP